VVFGLDDLEELLRELRLLNAAQGCDREVMFRSLLVPVILFP